MSRRDKTNIEILDACIAEQDMSVDFANLHNYPFNEQNVPKRTIDRSDLTTSLDEEKRVLEGPAHRMERRDKRRKIR